MRNTPKSFVRPALFTLAGMSLAAVPAEAQSNWSRQFRMGFVTAMNISADFNAGGTFDVPGSGPGQAGVPGQNHFYDGGDYVRVDSTGNSGGYTSFWSYSDAGQYNAAANTLTYSATTDYFLPDTQNSVSNDPYFGFDMDYGMRMTDLLGGDLSWQFGFSYLPISFSNYQSQDAQTRRVVHQYSTGGIVVPGAPYQGGPSGTGPLINDTATALPDVFTDGVLTGSRNLDSRLYNFRLGLNNRWSLGGRWSIGAGLGFAGGMVGSTFKYNETIYYNQGQPSSFNGGYDSTDFVYGGYGEMLLYWQAEKSGEFYIGAQYMGMTSVNLSDQGREAEIDLSGGIYLSAGINWAF